MDAYIVLVSPAYGGAEKRFFDIFRSLRASGLPVRLIASSTLADRLVADHPDDPLISDSILSVPLGTWRPLDFIRGYRKLLATLPSGSSFHYPMNCLWPLHLGRGDRVTMSITNVVKAPHFSFSDRNRAWSALSFYFVDAIDVLSPTILSDMAGYRMAGKMSLTPGGTFIQGAPELDQERKPQVVLLTRLIEKKGIDDLLDVVPVVWRNLKDRVPAEFSFGIAGFGPLEAHVVSRIDALAGQGLPIEFLGYAAPFSLFPGISVALSTQEVTNYPSRVVAEALVSGCGVIVRATGDSRNFGEMPGLLYCSADLDPAELADQIVTLVQAAAAEPQFSLDLRKAALDRFSLRNTSDYFARLLGLEPAGDATG